jgi:hypothetical protein
MQIRPLAAKAITVALLSNAGLAAATESLAALPPAPQGCTAQASQQFMPEADVLGIVERLGYRASRIRTEAGCYSVLAVDHAGKPFEIKFKGADLRMVSRYKVRSDGELATR